MGLKRKVCKNSGGGGGGGEREALQEGPAKPAPPLRKRAPGCWHPGALYAKRRRPPLISANVSFRPWKKPGAMAYGPRRQGRQFRKGRPSACARKEKARPHNLRGRAAVSEGRGLCGRLPANVRARISPCAQHRGRAALNEGRGREPALPTSVRARLSPCA